MRKIRNTMPFLHALLLSALLLAGCVREEFPGAGSVAEGEPARIELNLIVPTMSSGSSTRALTPEQENKIENLRVMVFRADGSVVSNGKYVSSGSKFTIDSYSGSNYTLFFIANVSNAEIEAKLQSATSLPEVEEIVTTATQLDFGMNTTHPLMMTGKQENVTFAPGNSTYGTPIQLHFIAAKVTLIVIDKTPADQGVSIIGWDVENAPARSYLFPHTADVNVNLPGTSADNLKDHIVSLWNLDITEDDFHAVLSMAECLYRHATHILSFLPATEVTRRGNADRDALVQCMKKRFTRIEFLQKAEEMGIKTATASTWLKRMLKNGLVENMDGKGTYQKP